MSALNWRLIREVYRKALERPQPERAAFLDAACSGDSGARERVTELLRSRPDPAAEATPVPGEEAVARFFEGLGRKVTGELEFRPGALLAGRYTVVEKIGSGGMGQIYRVRDAKMERNLAIKVLHPLLQGIAQDEQRFGNEAKLTGMLGRHPNVPPVHEEGRLEDKRPYFTMRLVEGKTLSEILGDTKRFKPRERTAKLLEILEKACAALQHAHEQGIVHRDLKPDNIMVGEYGEVQLMDWGIAKSLPHAGDGSRKAPADGPRPLGVASEPALTRADAVLGTIDYMAPEQARGEVARIDRRTDVFSLGAVLGEILTGLPPYRKEQGERPATPEAFGRAKDADLKAAHTRLGCCGADRELVALARDCLMPKPEDRPANAGVVAARLTEYLEMKRRQDRERLLLRFALFGVIPVAAVLLLWIGGAVARERIQRLLETEVRAIIDAQPEDSLEEVVNRIESAGPPPLRELSVGRLKTELQKASKFAVAETGNGPRAPPLPGRETEKEALARQLANVAAALVLLGEEQSVWPLLEHSLDPRLRYLLIHRLVTAGVSAELLTEKLRALLRAPSDSTAGSRQALVLCLGRFDTGALSKEERLSSPRTLPPGLKGALLEDLTAAYKNDPDAGVHSAIDWVLRRWGKGKDVQKLDRELSQERGEARLLERLARPDFSWQWYVTAQLHTMVIVNPEKYQVREMGLPPLPYLFAISSKEVTFRQFEEFQGEVVWNPGRADDRAVNMIYRKSVCAYCDELTKRENRAVSPFFRSAAVGKPAKVVLLEEAQGYRLPNAVEWKYACRAGTVTPRFYGTADKLLGEFAWFQGNSAGNVLKDPAGKILREEVVAAPVGRLMPNPLGLFDVYGNVEEYCLDSPFLGGIEPEMVWGGCYLDKPSQIHSDSNHPVGHVAPREVGFRIVRTLRKLR